LADFLSDGGAAPVIAWLNSENLTEAAHACETLAEVMKALGEDPPRSDTDVAMVYQLSAVNNPSNLSVQQAALKRVTNLCIQGNGAFIFLTATKERIEALTGAKDFGGRLVTQVSALNANAKTCALILSELNSTIQTLVSYVNTSVNQLAANASIKSSGSVTPAPRLVFHPQLTLNSVYAQIRPQLQTTYNAGPNQLSRFDSAAATLAVAVSRSQLVSATGGTPALQQLSNQLNAVAVQSQNLVGYLDSIAQKASSVKVSSSTASTGGNGQGATTTTSGGTTGSDNGTHTDPTKPIKGSSCTSC
jgi:hypothetical protein